MNQTLPDWNTIREGERIGETPTAFDAGLWFIGRISTPWREPIECPKRGDPENGPVCCIELNPAWEPALSGLLPKDQVQLLYWMHLGRRDLLVQHPRMDGATFGTFALRSPMRPNPIASSMVRLIDIDGCTLSVRGLDCVDGTPLLDIKPEHGAFHGVCPA